MKVLSGVLMVVMMMVMGCSTLQDLLVLEQPQTQGSELRDNRSEDTALVDSIPQVLATAGWDQEVLAASVPVDKWIVAYKPDSDQIEKRVIPADVLVQTKGQQGCQMVSISLKQVHNGTDYGPTELNAAGKPISVDCEGAATEAKRFGS